MGWLLFWFTQYSSRPIHNENDSLEFFPDENTVRLDEDFKASFEGLLADNELLSRQ